MTKIENKFKKYLHKDLGAKSALNNLVFRLLLLKVSIFTCFKSCQSIKWTLLAIVSPMQCVQTGPPLTSSRLKRNINPLYACMHSGKVGLAPPPRDSELEQLTWLPVQFCPEYTLDQSKSC